MNEFSITSNYKMHKVCITVMIKIVLSNSSTLNSLFQISSLLVSGSIQKNESSALVVGTPIHRLHRCFIYSLQGSLYKHCDNTIILYLSLTFSTHHLYYEMSKDKYSQRSNYNRVLNMLISLVGKHVSTRRSK